MNTDLSFITNEENQTLKERFEVLIKDTSFFDCLVGYFYSSGFYAIYHSLGNTESAQADKLLNYWKKPINPNNKLIFRTLKPDRKLKILFKKKWRILKTIEKLKKA